jgi:hypothetical protein
MGLTKNEVSNRGVYGLIFAGIGIAALEGIFASLPAFKGGTNDFSGGPARINELGWEIVNLPDGSSVIPHGQSMRMLNGGSNKVEVVGNISGNNLQLVQAEQTRRRGRTI